MSKAPQIAAVVLNWRDSPRTFTCVTALLEIPTLTHVYVVDNESTGELRRSLKDFESPSSRLSLLEFPENRGFAAGVNPAIRRALDAGATEVLVINNDAVVDGDSIDALHQKLLSDPALGLVGPQICHPNGEVESAGGYFNPLLGMTSHALRANTDPDFVTWACVLVRSEALEQIGLLDEDFFMYWEDVDFSVRLKSAGWKIAISTEAVAVHETSTNRKSLPVAIKAYSIWSALTFAKKHGGGWRVGRIVWLALTILANLIRGRLAMLVGIRDGLRLFREGSSPAFTSVLRAARFGTKQKKASAGQPDISRDRSSY